jgi:F0F1-type ATP synthase delta subunit
MAILYAVRRTLYATIGDRMELKLSTNVISQVDVARVLRELKALDDFFAASKVRAAGTPMQLPKLTRLLEQTAQENNYSLLEEKDRKSLIAQLDYIIGKAPLLHISFAAEPAPSALEKILVWFRENIHPQALLQVGLQPSIAAGCVLRTTNKVFDMSMREHLEQQQKFLAQLIDTAAKKQ